MHGPGYIIDQRNYLNCMLCIVSVLDENLVNPMALRVGVNSNVNISGGVYQNETKDALFDS